MQVIHNKILPPGLNQNTTTVQPQQVKPQNSFQSVLSRQLDASPLVFSKHASRRLSDREIELTTDQMQRVENGISKAREKGISDSLVLVDNVALVVNVKNRTVITALGRENEAENIFTNIDGAVIV